MNPTKKIYSFGFLSVRTHAELGYFGGLLTVNVLARPIEFHCTLPLKPTRAQSILYGPTLEDFVCGEQIARTLYIKAKVAPDLVFVDSSSILTLRNLVDVPVAWIQSDHDRNSVQLTKPKNSIADLETFQIGKSQLAILQRFSEDAKSIQSIWEEAAPQIDITEPFERISQALLEAHPAAKAA